MNRITDEELNELIAKIEADERRGADLTGWHITREKLKGLATDLRASRAEAARLRGALEKAVELYDKEIPIEKWDVRAKKIDPDRMEWITRDDMDVLWSWREQARAALVPEGCEPAQPPNLTGGHEL